MSSIDGSNQKNRGSSKIQNKNSNKKTREKDLERMEALLSQSAKGFHIIFDHSTLARVFREPHDDKDFLDVEKMRKVQDAMTGLVAQKTYYDKVSFVKSLPAESYRMLVRAYFHIVENSVRASTDHSH